MIFLTILAGLCFVSAVVLSVIAWRKTSLTYVTLALIPVILLMILVCIGRSQLIQKTANIVTIEVIRTLPDKFTKEDAERMNEKISSISRNQGTIFSWYNDINLTPLNVENYQYRTKYENINL